MNVDKKLVILIVAILAAFAAYFGVDLGSILGN